VIPLNVPCAAFISIGYKCFFLLFLSLLKQNKKEQISPTGIANNRTVTKQEKVLFTGRVSFPLVDYSHGRNHLSGSNLFSGNAPNCRLKSRDNKRKNKKRNTSQLEAKI
jgi:hypothetical protein